MVEKTKTFKILSNLPSFLDRTGNNYDFITSFDASFQSTEDNIVLLKKSMQISTATGTNLDDIAYLFSLNRMAGEADSVFRARIRSFWQSNKKGGTTDNVKLSIANVLGVSVDNITIVESLLSIDITIIIPDDFDFSVANNLVNTINDSKAAGIYYGGLDCTSWDTENNKFLVNFSSINGGNTLL